jgi:hypothetical protein
VELKNNPKRGEKLNFKSDAHFFCSLVDHNQNFFIKQKLQKGHIFANYLLVFRIKSLPPQICRLLSE